MVAMDAFNAAMNWLSKSPPKPEVEAKEQVPNVSQRWSLKVRFRTLLISQHSPKKGGGLPALLLTPLVNEMHFTPTGINMGGGNNWFQMQNLNI